MVPTLPLAGPSSTGSPFDDITTRRKLSEISLAVAKSKRIVVVTGAGISCSCGIPDFRSSDGLYNLVKSQYPNTVVKGRDLFDSSLFRDPSSTALFYTFIAGLKQAIDNAEPGPTHRFIKTLDSKGKLLRSYTQNIDGLEERLGLVGSSSVPANPKSSDKGKSKSKIAEVKNILLHGDVHRVRCTLCSYSSFCELSHLENFRNGIPPECPECSERSSARVARSQRSVAVGILRPSIVLYDEPHPMGDEIGKMETRDLAKKPDLLIVMGTSLKVHGLKKLVKEFASAVHATGSSAASSSLKPPASKAMLGKVIFVNKTPPSSEWTGIIDYHVEGATDDFAQKVMHDWKKARPQDWEVQRTLLDVPERAALQNIATMKIVKDMGSTAKSKTKGKAVKGQIKPKASAEDDENCDPRLSQQTLVGDDDYDPFLSQQPLPKLKKKTTASRAFATTRPPKPTTSAVPLSPSKRMNEASSRAYSRSSESTDVEDMDSDLELSGSPRKKRIIRQDELGDVSMRSDRGLLDFSSPMKIDAISLEDQVSPIRKTKKNMKLAPRPRLGRPVN